MARQKKPGNIAFFRSEIHVPNFCGYHHPRISAALRVILLMLIAWAGVSWAGEVRIDFLMEAKGQEDLARVMERNGVSKEATARLAGAMKDFYEEPFEMELKKFPARRDGAYVFESMERLTNALPGKLWETTHKWSLNCFDTVSLAAGEKIGYRLKRDSLAGPFFAVVPHTNELSIRPCATPEDAFTSKYPEYYRDGTKKYFSEGTLQERRVCATALLFSYYILPLEMEETDLEPMALKVLQARWERYGVKFKDVEVVLAHEVSFAGRFFTTSHAGLLMRDGDRFVYFEKCGGSGPFVRLGFEKREELMVWYADKYRGANANGYSHTLISFDDREMRVVRK